MNNLMQPINPSGGQQATMTLTCFKAYDIRGKLGVMSAFIKKALFGGIDDAHEIEQHTGLAVFASVPSSEKQVSLYEKIQAKAMGMFVLEKVDTHDAAIESLRSLHRAAVCYAGCQKQPGDDHRRDHAERAYGNQHTGGQGGRHQVGRFDRDREALHTGRCQGHRCGV